MKRNKWFNIAYRASIEKYGCSRCIFVLATYGRYDAAFGVGRPILCADCINIKEENDEDWRLVNPKVAYDEPTQSIIKELGDKWYVPMIPRGCE